MRSSLDEFLDITKECKVIGDYIGTITWGRGKNPNIVVYYEGDPKHNKNEFCSDAASYNGSLSDAVHVKGSPV